MWFCSSCRNQIEDKYQHCWQCGAKRVVGTKPGTKPGARTTPQFASYEEMAKVPDRPMFIFRRGLLQRILWFGLGVVLVKVLVVLDKFFGSPFLGKYGLYIVIAGGVIALILILWRSFRRDPSEGVGVKLN